MSLDVLISFNGSITIDLLVSVPLSTSFLRVAVSACLYEFSTCKSFEAFHAVFPLGSVVSITLVLLHINDLLTSGVDESTVVQRFQSSSRVSRIKIELKKEALVECVPFTLQTVFDWEKVL